MLNLICRDTFIKSIFLKMRYCFIDLFKYCFRMPNALSGSNFKYILVRYIVALTLDG